MKQRECSIVKRLYLREITGSLSFKTSGLSHGRLYSVYEKCPKHLQISLRNIISQKNLLLGHVIIGFSRDGKYLLSYQCRITDTMGESCFSLEYKYSLHWWQFHYKTPARKVHTVSLFVGEHIENSLHLLICQPPCGNYIIVHGSTSRQNDRSSLSSSCYVTVAPSPAKNVSKDITHSSKCTILFSVHLKYELVPPYPPFLPSVNLKLNDTILLNSGDTISAVNCYGSSNNNSTCEENCGAMFGPVGSKKTCLCLSKEELPRDGNNDYYKADGWTEKLDRSCCSAGEKRESPTAFSQNVNSFDKLNSDSRVNEAVEANTKEIDCSSGEPNSNCTCIRRDSACSCLDAAPSSNASHYTNFSQPRHTSCYVNYYSRNLDTQTETLNAPFDCTSTAFPVKVTTPSGENLQQIYNHRCLENTENSQETHINAQSDLVVKQTVFDAEQFLDSQFQCMESIKHNFVSLKDYDLQIVQVCQFTKNVIILIKALINLRGSDSNCRLQTSMTGFLFSWNMQNGSVEIFERHPVVEFQKPKCKSRSVFHGLEQAVELRKKHFWPANLSQSVLSFSNHTVFSGKSKKYLLHPFQPLAIVM